MSAGRIFAALLRHKLVVLGLTAVLVGAVLAVEVTSAARYRAAVLLEVQAPADSSGAISIEGTLSARERAVTITALGNTRNVSHRARARLAHVSGIDCSFAQEGQSEYLVATCTGEVAASVARGADAFARALLAMLADQRSARVDALRAQYLDQVAALRVAGVPSADYPAPPTYPTARELLVIDWARTPDAPFAPQPKRAVVLALVLGLLLNSGIALALDRMQNRACTPDELRSALGEPVLVAIPKLRGGAGR